MEDYNAQNKNSKRWVTIAFIAVAAALIIWSIVARQRTRMQAQKGMNSWVGQQAAELSLEDLQGKTHKLSDYRGKNVLLMFWATWCPPCRAEVPHLIELRKTVGADKLAILAISNEDEDTIKSFVKAMDINYTVLTVYDKSLPEPYGMVTAIPTAFFIDQEGKITKIHIGGMGLEDLKMGLGVN